MWKMARFICKASLGALMITTLLAGCGLEPLFDIGKPGASLFPVPDTPVSEDVYNPSVLEEVYSSD
ncbi:hypothetical protein [Paenibacillus tuaregi]|uniref:hypothetical protein n=1 Tax=Paenibacillus tuaregi TaxID=1816681 RepID=UPI000839A85B|nr:hypothetical protein [Paenibacillus tuaregi]